MECEYGYSDCRNLGTDKCAMCIDAYNYVQIKQKVYKRNIIKTKETKRQGAISEVKSFKQMQQALDTSVTGTPNSGAGRIKGDEQIRGLINVMTELKTTTKKNEGRQPGKETFTIKREWMDKLEREAREANMEFNYLKFSFKEHDDKFYAVTDVDIIIDMIVTMKNDRLTAKEAQNRIDVAEKRAALKDAENTKLLAEIELLKAEIKQTKEKDKINI